VLNAAAFLKASAEWVPVLATLAFCGAALAIAKFLLLGKKSQRQHKEVPWPRQMTYLTLILAALVSVILALPIESAAKGQLLSLLGILLTAAIALASTTFVGNAMAGLMLRSLGNFRPGDFVKVGDAFGRVTVRGLLHTELQTEDRDLTTLPNLSLVTSPVTVVHATGTIVSATVSLGYDVERHEVEPLLLAAAKAAALGEAFVQILELGDFAITYRIAGFLAEVKYLLTARSRLRGKMIDSLHAAGIEIVSPTFMNQRPITHEVVAARPRVPSAGGKGSKAPEDVMFDKAEEAQTREQIVLRLEELMDMHQKLVQQTSKADDPAARRSALQLSLVKREIARLQTLLSEDKA